MTGAISSLAIGSDQVKSVAGLNPFDSLYFVGLLLFLMTLRPQHVVRAVRASGPKGLLMTAIAPTTHVRSTVELALRGSKRDVAGRVFQAALLLSLLLSLAILIVLLGTACPMHGPCCPRGSAISCRATCRSSPSRRRPSRHRGIVDPHRLRGRRGAPGGHRGSGLPTRVRARHATQPTADHEHPQSRRGAVDRVRHPLVVFVKTLRSITGPETFGRSYVSGGMTLAVLVLPIVILITMEALRGSKSLREAVPTGSGRRTGK